MYYFTNALTTLIFTRFSRNVTYTSYSYTYYYFLLLLLLLFLLSQPAYTFYLRGLRRILLSGLLEKSPEQLNCIEMNHIYSWCYIMKNTTYILISVIHKLCLDSWLEKDLSRGSSWPR